jgi:hypothetical protein
MKAPVMRVLLGHGSDPGARTALHDHPWGPAGSRGPTPGNPRSKNPSDFPDPDLTAALGDSPRSAGPGPVDP